MQGLSLLALTPPVSFIPTDCAPSITRPLLAGIAGGRSGVGILGSASVLVGSPVVVVVGFAIFGSTFFSLIFLGGGVSTSCYVATVRIFSRTLRGCDLCLVIPVDRASMLSILLG